MRIRVQSYGPSKSARALASYLGVKRILSKNSKFRGRYTDIIVNWGNVKHVHSKSTYLNPLDSVATASNKLATFKALQAAGVSIPQFDTNCSFADDSSLVMARTTLHGHSGQGIILGTPSELPYAPLYVEYIPKVSEFRAIVVAGKVVDFKQKKRKRDWQADRSEEIWNCDNGFVFCRNDIETPEEAFNQSILALDAINLRYGAVDIIKGEDGNFYVLEINTAPGLVESTIPLVGEAIKDLL